MTKCENSSLIESCLKSIIYKALESHIMINRTLIVDGAEQLYLILTMLIQFEFHILHINQDNCVAITTISDLYK